MVFRLSTDPKRIVFVIIYRLVPDTVLHYFDESTLTSGRPVMKKAIGALLVILLSSPFAVLANERTFRERKANRENYEEPVTKFLTESDNHVERLAALGRVWGAAKFFHPYLAYKDIDWDGALIKAIPEVKAAQTPEQYQRAIDNMLQVLNDPATTVDLVKVEAEK